VFQAQYSHDFDGASYKVTAFARLVHPAALAAAAGLEADAEAEAAMIIRPPPSPHMSPAPGGRLCNAYGRKAERVLTCPVGSQCGRNPMTGNKSGMQV
jgi:hypothetical protein